MGAPAAPMTMAVAAVPPRSPVQGRGDPADAPTLRPWAPKEVGTKARDQACSSHGSQPRDWRRLPLAFKTTLAFQGTCSGPMCPGGEQGLCHPRGWTGRDIGGKREGLALVRREDLGPRACAGTHHTACQDPDQRPKRRPVHQAT